MKQEPVLTTRFIKQARKHQNAQQDKEVLPQPGIEPGPLPGLWVAGPASYHRTTKS